MNFLSIFSIIKKTYYFLSYIESNFVREMKGTGQAEKRKGPAGEGRCRRRPTENEFNSLYIQV